MLKVIGASLAIVFTATIFSNTPNNILVNQSLIHIEPLAENIIKQTQQSQYIILTEAGAEEFSDYTMNYFPGSEKVTISNASVLTVNKQIVTIPKSNYALKRSAASEDAPGFTNSLTLSIQFPKLLPQEQVNITSEVTEFLKSKNNFLPTFEPVPDSPTKILDITLTQQPFLTIYWAKSKAFQIEKTPNEQLFRLKNQAAITPEVAMVASSDILPYVSLSTVPSWKDYGNYLWGAIKPAYTVTPTIQALADQITGNSTGLTAAKKLYAWEVSHIHYVAIYLNQGAELIPNNPELILQRGYGDCKDYVALLSMLLKAKNIAAEPALVNWSNAFRRYPIPSNLQFNHAILYLPHYHIFINPTDTNSGFAELDPLLTNKPAVVLSNDSRMMNTQAGNAKTNAAFSVAHTFLDTNGNLQGTTSNHYRGNINTSIRSAVMSVNSGRELANILLSATFYGGQGQFQWSNPNNVLVPMSLNSTWQARQAVAVRDDFFMRMPAGPTILSIDTYKSSLTLTPRQYAFVTNNQTLDNQQTLTLPKGYHFKQYPKNIHYKNAIAEFKVTYTPVKNNLTRHWILVINQNLISAKQYPLYLNVIEKALEDQHAFIEIVKD